MRRRLIMEKYGAVNDKCVYLCFWCSDKGVLLQHFNESNLSLQQSQPHTNADTWTKSKRHVAELRSLGFLFWSEPVGKADILDLHN